MELQQDQAVAPSSSVKKKQVEWEGPGDKTYGGDDLAWACWAGPLGLPVPERDGCWEGADAAAVACVEDVRWMAGEADAAGAALACAGAVSAPKLGRSWGAGEGAMAIAALMVRVGQSQRGEWRGWRWEDW